MKSKKAENVVVLGASSNPDRYSNMAMQRLEEHGHHVIPVHPSEKEILGHKVIASLNNLRGQSIDTLTIYVNPKASSELEKEIIELKPKRVIFNPNTENPPLEKELEANGMKTLHACTLVLLSTNQF